MTYRRLTNIPLVDEKTGVVRGRRCNLITLYCPVCDQFYLLERKDIVCVTSKEKSYLCCYESIKDLIKNE